MRRLTMQRRIFRVGGLPFVAARDGFIETHGTLAALIEKHRPGATTDRGADTGVAPTPAQVASDETVTLAATLGALDPAEPEAPRPNTGAPSAKSRKARGPRPKAPPASTGAAPNDTAADEPTEAEEVVAAVEAVQNSGPKARVVGRRRAGQPPTPRWMTAGKERRGRLK